MALRVLLADESTTIRKVIELALQDYAVTVKTVNVGTDALHVAQTFQPDIVFIDVLLPKRNGYDVCKDLKGDINLSQTPVVLMWSGFMEIDEEQLQGHAPDGRLEKPFETEQLRRLVEDLIPKTRQQKLSQFLEFPDLPNIEENNSSPQPGPVSELDSPPPPLTDLGDEFTMESLESEPEAATPPPTDQFDVPEGLDELTSPSPTAPSEEPDMISLDETWAHPPKMDGVAEDGLAIPEGLDDDFSKVNLSEIKDSGLLDDSEPPTAPPTADLGHDSSLDTAPPIELEEIDLDSDMTMSTQIPPSVPPTGAPEDLTQDLTSPPPQMDFSANENSGDTVEIETVDLLDDSLNTPDLPPPTDDFATTDLAQNDAMVEDVSSDDLDKYRVDMNTAEDDGINYSIEDDISDDDFLMSDQIASSDSVSMSSDQVDRAIKEHVTASIDYSKIEELISSQVKPIIQDIVWKVVPEIAERVIKKEIDKLMEDVEKDFDGQL